MQLRRQILNDFIIPAGRPVYWLFRTAYGLLFGWLNESLARSNEKRLAADIEMAMPFLFDVYCGRASPDSNGSDRSLFDYATIVIHLNSFVLRFTRGRGELSVAASPVGERPDWYDIGSLIRFIDPALKNDVPSHFADPWRVASVIEPYMEQLSEILSLDRFPSIRRKLIDSRELNVADIEAWQTRINSRLGLKK